MTERVGGKEGARHPPRQFSGQRLIPGCEQQLWGASKSLQIFGLGQHDWEFEGALMQAQGGSPLKFSLPSSSPPRAFQERNGGKSLMAGLSQQISLSFCTCKESYPISQCRCHWHSFSGLDGLLPSEKHTCSLTCPCLKYPGKDLREYEQSPKYNRNSNKQTKKSLIKVQLGLV